MHGFVCDLVEQSWVVCEGRVMNAVLEVTFIPRPDGGRSSVVRAAGFKSDDPGFDPLEEQGEGPFFCPSESTLAQTYLCP